ncbi:MAG: hypothetical protein FIB04_12970 [Gammaproteobacteria bacterium]|nr:hypothetical protein [Gammaproteobacteria bacterium]
MARVLVLHARLAPVIGNSVPGTAFPLLERLPYARRLELERRDAAGRNASLAGIALVLQGSQRLRGTIIGADALRFPAGGKPYCEGGPFFSVSHGTTRVAVAISDDVDLGFDLEEIARPLPSERDPLDRLRRWTATEAVLKAAGLGLRDARAVELEDGLAAGSVQGRRFLLGPVPIGPDVVAHVATPRKIASLDVATTDASDPGR